MCLPHYVVYSAPDGPSHPGLPPLDREAANAEIRLAVLPPGAIDARISMKRALIDVNISETDLQFAVNSDRRRACAAPPESLAFFPRGCDFSIATRNSLPGCVLEIADTTLDRWFDAADLDPADTPEHLFYAPDPVAADLGRAAIRSLSCANGRQCDTLTLEALALGLAARIIARLSARGGDVETELLTWSRHGTDRRIQRAVDWAEVHLCNPGLSVRDMAAAAGVSSCHFGVIFKAQTGESAYAFILRRRVELARDLIVGTDMPLAKAAYTAGFSSQAHMTNVMRRILGTTPGKLRLGPGG